MMGTPSVNARRRDGHAYGVNGHAWEMRASVTEDTFKFVYDQALALGRSRTWQAGLYVEAMAQAAKEMTPEEQTQLDVAMRTPGALLRILRAGMSSTAA